MSNKNDRWSALSMKERADLINMYITNGISDLKEMKKHYNSFGNGEDTDDTKVQIPTTNIITTDNYQEKLNEFNQYRQKAVMAIDLYDWDTFEENLNKSDSLGRELAKYTLNANDAYVGSPLNKGNWAGTSEAREPEDINFLLKHNIREEGKDVTEWLKSYVNSEGFDRVRKNQESWWKNRHPYQKILFPIFMGIENNKDLNRYKQNISNHADKMLNYVLDGYTEMSFALPYKGSTFTFKPKIKEDKKLPFDFTQMHEFDHLFNDAASSYSTINAGAMEQNTNTERGHDSFPDEKHSDIIGLKYLLYKEGIYDARGGNDITPEQIRELRKKYPELRPLIQIDDAKAAWMLNHVAQNTTNENRLDYVNPDNIVAFGGKLNKFEYGGNTDNTVYYDDTPIETPVVRAFNSQEDYNRYYGEQSGKKVAEGMNNAAPYVLEAAMLPFNIAGIAEAPMLIYKGVKHVPKLMKGLKDLPTKVRISNKKLGKLFDFTDTKMPIKEGSESVVYIGDDKVFKVPSEGSPEMTLDELVEFNKNYISKRNTPPHTAPLAVEGVVKGSTKGKYYPVYSQQKLNVVGEDTMPFWEWEKHRALLDEKMAKSGWPDIGGAYYNKDLNLHVGDIKPSNVAYDNKGNLLIIDGDVYGNGGKLLTKNKK